MNFLGCGNNSCGGNSYIWIILILILFCGCGNSGSICAPSTNNNCCCD